MGHAISDKSFTLRHYPVLASVSRSYSELIDMFPCVTHPCATLMSNSKLLNNPVQLACVKPAASVRSEPGSNSHIKFMIAHPSLNILIKNFLGSFIQILRLYTFLKYIPPAYPLAYLLYSITTSAAHQHRVGMRWYNRLISNCQHKKLKKIIFLHTK